MEQLIERLSRDRKTWLLTGVAGFIGSNLLEALLRANQAVVGIDNFATGHQRNLDDVRKNVGEARWENFTFVRGDIVDLETCKRACAGVDYVLHQAAIGSVPRSIQNPIFTHQNNVDGFLNMLVAAKDAKVKRFVYASSSSVYGDHPALPKVEQTIGECLSPYAVSKRINELYADVFAKCYGFECIGLRYFNVFGPRQDPNGVYAAVIPKWIAAMLRAEAVYINGDGETSRDFCFVANVVQANLLAATTQNAGALNQRYNIAAARRTTLNQLFESLRDRLTPRFPQLKELKPVYRAFQPGDVRHSHADISKARELLGYNPTHDVDAGLTEALDWYIEDAEKARGAATAKAV
ncbi:MAG TPA: SDR family oxidoreductase [Candidatus Angelobacter sp.]|nr:SDR family oxidoreductase [Candidatus Angelobacter sp.]